MKILIYSDYGTSKASVEQLIKCFTALVNNRKTHPDNNCIIELISGSDLNNDSTLFSDPKSTILCIGGGFDLGYMQSIGEEGCVRIREFVSNGGKYLGICAGAYFASDYVQFDLNGPLEVKGSRLLKFFTGRAVGPVNSNFEYNSDKTAEAIGVSFGLKTYRFYMNGGCFFEQTGPLQAGLEVLGKYVVDGSDELVNGKAAVLKCSYGEGVCLLSGAHIEFDPNDFELNESVGTGLKSEFETNGYGLLEELLQKYFDF
jgi:biotin--protein ligase